MLFKYDQICIRYLFTDDSTIFYDVCNSPETIDSLQYDLKLSGCTTRTFQCRYIKANLVDYEDKKISLTDYQYDNNLAITRGNIEKT